MRKFWVVAAEGNLMRTAERMRVSEAALSRQLHQLEEQPCARASR